MRPEQSQPEVENLAARREFVRRSVLRANRAIAVILAVVLLLGVVLVVLITQSRRSQARAEQAEAAETERLWKASLAQARAENLSTRAGHRAAALEAVRTAADIRPSLELRNEAIAALMQRDLAPDRQWALQPGAYGYIFDPELKYYAVRYNEKVLSLYRMEDNAHVRDFPMPFIYPKEANLGDFSFSRTGRYLILRYNGGGLTQCEVETGKMLRILSADPRMQNYSWPPSFSADDRLMGIHMTGTAGTQFVYDLEHGEVRQVPSHPPELRYNGGNNYTRLSPDGKWVAGFSGQSVLVVDATTGEICHRTKGPSEVQMLGWDMTGDRLAFSCDDQSLYVWEPVTDRTVQFGGRALVPWQQNFSPDGTLFLTGGQDGVGRLWDVESASLLSEIKGVLGAAFSSDGSRIAGGAAGQSVGTWRIEQPAAMTMHRGAWRQRSTVWQLDVSPDGRTAIWSPPGQAGSHGFEIRDLERGTSIVRRNAERLIAGLRPGHAQYWTTGAGAIKIYPLPQEGADAEESPVLTVPLPAGFRGHKVTFSADGRYSAVAGPNRALLVYDLQTPDKPVTMEPAFVSRDDSLMGPGSPTGGGVLVMSPDGTRVAAGYNLDGGRPVIWDARTGKIIHRLNTSQSYLTWSPDGRFLAAAGQNRVRLFSTADWSLLWTRDRDRQLAYFGSVAFTGDSSLLSCAMGTSRLEFFTTAGENVASWDMKDLKFIANQRFTAGGEKLIVGGMEGRIATLDLRTLRTRLREMNLDWPLPPATTAPAPAVSSTWTPALLSVIPVGLAAVLGALVLRRQRRLTGEFVETTELAARRTQELAAEREVSELKSRFVTTVSHEFRTPLGITMSAIELLRHYEDRLPPGEKAQLFDDIHTATRNMAGLMEQVLVLGRVDAGKLAYRPAPLDLDTLARKLADESLSATNRKCPIEWRAENDLSGAHADEALLRHILSNLLSNGVKYSPAGTPVHFSARREGLMAVFTVKDSGIGIPETDLPQLFEAFHRGSNVGEIPGTGLGLVIIKRCADLHGGSIQVKSKPGEGTAFTVRVPAWV